MRNKLSGLSAVAIFLAGCGSGGSDTGGSVSADPATTPSPAPVPAPPPSVAPSPVAAPVPSPIPAPAPNPSPSPVPSPQPAPAPAPAGLQLQGNYPQATLQCASGTPMAFQFAWTVSYNGGVSHFAPEGYGETLISWQTASLVTQQHSNGATFSAPSSNAGQTWLTVDTAGEIIGAGYHGATPDTYVRCGVAMIGQAQVPVPPGVTLRCQSGYQELVSPAPVTHITSTTFERAQYDPQLGPVGAFSITNDPNAPWRTRPTESEVRRLPGGDALALTFRLYPNTPESSTYYLRDGNLVAYTYTYASPHASALAPACGELQYE